jgi:hypothetical protein
MRGGPPRFAVHLVSGCPRMGTHAPADSLAISRANASVRSAPASSRAAAPFTMKLAARGAAGWMRRSDTHHLSLHSVRGNLDGTVVNLRHGE